MKSNPFAPWICVAACVLSLSGAGVSADNFDATTDTVGRKADGLETPDNQRLTPAGKLVELPGMRPQALALSPDGKLLVTAGLTHELVILNPADGTTVAHVPFPSGGSPEQAPVSAEILNPDGKAQLSFTGLKFSPDGSRIFMANVNGDIKVFAVAKDHKVTGLNSFALPAATAPRRKEEIPAGLAVSADGKRLYVALNLSNKLVEMDAATGRVLRTWDIGVAPFDVVLSGHKVYVSNWGGRRPDADSVTGPAGHGTLVRVDSRSIASEGSVSVVELDQEQNGGRESSEILTGLHACAMALSPNGRQLVVANAGSDTLSVIDTHAGKVVDTICARQNPGDLFGAQPNALAFDKTGRKLFVCNGTQNAVAVFNYEAPARLFGLFPMHIFVPGQVELAGLIPVGWFPGAIVYDSRHKAICVANIKHIGPGRDHKPGGEKEFNTKQYYGSLSIVPVPGAKQLADFTHTALADLRYPLLAQAKLPPRADVPVRPVPERAGEPSVFKHVIYFIKENRTYDQVLGDVQEGNGDPDLCIFGKRITPNLHKLVRDFVLLDNTYCSGILSADGHQWTDTGIATEYVERSFAGWPRSYPAGGEDGKDALAYSPAGFIWNDALAHGRSVLDFGEFTTPYKRWKDPSRKREPTFTDCYRDFTTGANEIEYWSEPDIESMRPYVVTNTLGFDLDVPDIWRAARFKESLAEFEKSDNMPNLVVIWIPNDHTSGTKPGEATPAAHAADNDLAVGQVVEAVSHSRFWKDTCIFGVEDDPQNGWDHVSGYRTTAYVFSPYTRRGAVVKTQYNQTSILRTMELILGLPPMNQMDATATPMFDCFTDAPDFNPYDAVTNTVALDTLNPKPKRLSDATLRNDALISARLPLKKEDQCPEDVLNLILWHAMKGSQTRYPEWAVKTVDDD